MRKLLVMMMGLAGVLPGFGMIESINYAGRLVPVNGAAFNGQSAMTLTFRLYDRETGGTALWGRRYSVIVAADGSFSIALTDDEGMAVSDAKYDDLAQACAAAETLYIGLTPKDQNGNMALEFTPRQRLGRAFAAEVAAVAAAAETVRMADLTVKGTLTTPVLNAKTLTVGTLPTSARYEPADGSALEIGAGATLKLNTSYFCSKSYSDLYEMWERKKTYGVYRYNLKPHVGTLVAWKSTDSIFLQPTRLYTEFVAPSAVDGETVLKENDRYPIIQSLGEK